MSLEVGSDTLVRQPVRDLSEAEIDAVTGAYSSYEEAAAEAPSPFMGQLSWEDWNTLAGGSNVVDRDVWNGNDAPNTWCAAWITFDDGGGSYTYGYVVS